ncbi:MAG: hypothetical protein MUC81_08960 [Bacteroidia bacterium]|jgi:hypothetical protein|nr:hypothetical protein [Bacteroidia bacterium]
MNQLKTSIGILSILLISACSSTTNVYDYYIRNVVESHQTGQLSTGSTKLLFRKIENPSKAQLELVYFKNDTNKVLVFGSHKVVKSFYLQDSVYYFDVTDLYNKVRGDDFIRQMGNLNIFFTHVPAAAIEKFLADWPSIKQSYTMLKPMKETTEEITYAIAYDVMVSFSKTQLGQKPDKAVLWIGKRKHEINTDELIAVFTAFQALK